MLDMLCRQRMLCPHAVLRCVVTLWLLPVLRQAQCVLVLMCLHPLWVLWVLLAPGALLRNQRGAAVEGWWAVGNSG